MDPDNDQSCEVYAQKPVLPTPISLQQVASTLTPEAEKCHPKAIPDESHQPNNLTFDALNKFSNNSVVPSSPSLSRAIGGSNRRGESPATSRTGSLRRRNKSAPRNTFDDYEDRAVPALRQYVLHYVDYLVAFGFVCFDKVLCVCVICMHALVLQFTN